MNKKLILLTTIFAFTALILAACSGAAQAPASAPTNASSTSAAQPSAAKSSSAAFETKSNEGGSVTVKVTPLALSIEQPLAFDIVMDTHSVDLSDDMTKVALLRDDKGKEFQPTAWEGAGPGGHHREGKLKFGTLTNKPKYVELVIKGLANVPERVFRWDVS
ncbi:MAG: hypothetical protein HY868_00665 [Chloroflexi bacterium]|nr:hypothetical protein [Chloroflexota bacterium]